MEKWRDVAIWLQQSYMENPAVWDFFIAITVLLVTLKILSRPRIGSWVPIHPRGRAKMLRRARRNFVRRETIDALIDHVEGKVFTGEYSRAEANELYRDARKYWPVKDLFPSPEMLKVNIQKRLLSKTHAPVALPGSVVAEVKKKHMFSK